jgi:plastocyanin
VAQRVVWTVIVAFFALLFVLAPAKILREQNRNDEPLDEQPASASAAKDAAPAATGTLVTMEGLKFKPARLVVAKGATVRFENKDVAPHTVTASSGPVDSGVLNPGQTFEAIVDAPFDYVCTIHPSMKASIELSG